MSLRPAGTVVIYGVALLSSISTASLLRAQSTADAHFDVASIKLNTDGDYRVYVADNLGGRFAATGMTFRVLMRYGYDIQDFQIIGGPPWLGTDRWNIEAKAEGVSGRLPVERQKQMIRALLADRFQFKAHFEKKKPVPAYALVVAKNGPKLNIAAENTAAEIQLSRGRLSLKKARVSALAAQLTRLLGRQVLDKTNLTGEYNFTLDWTPEAGESGVIPGQPGPPPEARADNEDSKPSLFTALPAQLGLRLQATKAPLDVLVLDRVAKPSQN